jgi:8-oxo-dGTP diphosphatase
MVNVVGAIIINEGKLMAARRSYGKLAGKYEFPGGKIELGENDKEALIREIKEELGVDATIFNQFMKTSHQYHNINLEVSLITYLAKIDSLDFKLNSHDKIEWLTKDELFSVDWLEADLPIVSKIEEIL